MENIKKFFLPLFIFYLALMCFYVSYLYIVHDYNITKNIFRPYKTFIQLSSFSYKNVFITIIKGLAGLIGFGIYLIKGKKVNYFNTLFIFISIFEIIVIASLQFGVFKDFSNYIDQTSVVLSAVLFILISYFYFRSSEIKKLFLPIIVSFFITAISYYLH